MSSDLAAFNARCSRGFAHAIGLAGHPAHINAAPAYWLDAIKLCIAAAHAAKNDSQPLLVLDIGCGRTSFLTPELKCEYPYLLYGMDISAEEMEQNDLLDERIVYDAGNARYRNDLARYANTFDVIISHTFLEHVGQPETVHGLINFLLRDSGVIVHLYPTLFDPFLTLNHLLPDRLTEPILKILQPSREKTGKFPSFYKHCRACSPKLQLMYRELGLRVLRYRNFYGTHYLYRFFPLQAIMDLFYLLALKLDFRPLTSMSCIILSKHKNEDSSY